MSRLEAARRRRFRPARPSHGTSLVDLDFNWLGLRALLYGQFQYPVSVGRAYAITPRVERKRECAFDGTVSSLCSMKLGLLQPLRPLALGCHHQRIGLYLHVD
jgi:hypothetical protein